MSTLPVSPSISSRAMVSWNLETKAGHTVTGGTHQLHQRQLSPGRILTYTVLGFWSVVCLFPLYWLAATSLKNEYQILDGPLYLPFVDFTPTLEAWSGLLTDPNDNLLPRYFNSAIVSSISTLVSLLLGAMAVYGLSRFRFRVANRAILLVTLGTRLLPPVVIVLPLYMMAQFTGTLDTRFVLMFTYAAINLPVAIWLLRPVLGFTASDQEEAAQLDGASHFEIFFTITLPMAAKGIAAAGLLIFILCWNEYLFAVYLAGDHAMTLPPWLVGQLSFKEAQVGSEAQEVARFSAATIMMALPLLAFTAAAQRALSRSSLWQR
jgi:multiple sugar transport system permease protein